LINLKQRLRKFSVAERQNLRIGADELAAGYHELVVNSPRRRQPYLSKTRNGVAPRDSTGRRFEERLAMALFNQQVLRFDSGARLKLLDYQFPLKSDQSDHDIGKIDLLGQYDDGALAVVELKIEDNTEDRRIGLIEGLIYAAIVEANLARITSEIEEVRRDKVTVTRPSILYVAPKKFWSNPASYPPTSDVMSVAKEVMAAVPIRIDFAMLEGCERIEQGLDGSKPTVPSGVHLSPVTV